MTLETRNGFGMASNDTEMTSEWWYRNYWMILEWLEWGRNDRMTWKSRTGIRITSNYTGMTLKWSYSDRMSWEWLNDIGMTGMSPGW